MNPKVSIILPTWNGSKYIERAIDSVLGQTFFDYELVIINDGSTDNTEEIIKRYVSKDKRIIYLYQEHHNPGYTKRMGINYSKGELIAFLDDDDIWIDKNKLKEQVKFLDENPSYVLVGSNGVIIDENNKKVIDYDVPAKDEDIRESILLKNQFIQSSVLIRKDILDTADSFPEKRGKYAEDYRLWLSVGLLGKFANLERVMVSYTTRVGSVSYNNKKDIFKNNLKLIKKFENKYPNYYKALFFSKIKYYIYLIVIGLFGNSKIKDKILIFLYKKYRKLKM